MMSCRSRPNLVQIQTWTLLSLRKSRIQFVVCCLHYDFEVVLPKIITEHCTRIGDCTYINQDSDCVVRAQLLCLNKSNAAVNTP